MSLRPSYFISWKIGLSPLGRRRRHLRAQRGRSELVKTIQGEDRPCDSLRSTECSPSTRSVKRSFLRRFGAQSGDLFLGLSSQRVRSRNTHARYRDSCAHVHTYARFVGRVARARGSFSIKRPPPLFLPREEGIALTVT